MGLDLCEAGVDVDGPGARGASRGLDVGWGCWGVLKRISQRNQWVESLLPGSPGGGVEVIDQRCEASLQEVVMVIGTTGRIYRWWR